jgi:hypothetical protein
MKDGNWESIILGLLGFGLSITLTLIGIIFSWLKARIDKNEEKAAKELSEFKHQMLERLRTLGHEDRDIRTQINGIWQIFVQSLKEK